MINHHDLKPTIRIGKNGITAQIVLDVKRQLAQRKVVKVKFLKTAVDSSQRKEAILELAAKTGGKVVHKVGGVVVLAKHGIL